MMPQSSSKLSGRNCHAFHAGFAVPKHVLMPEDWFRLSDLLSIVKLLVIYQQLWVLFDVQY